MTGKNKKMNFSIFKGIKINKIQDENWNPKLIRKVLENNPIELLREICVLMGKKMEYIITPNEKDKLLIEKIMEMIR